MKPGLSDVNQNPCEKLEGIEDFRRLAEGRGALAPVTDFGACPSKLILSRLSVGRSR
jgi:hypothetical protein